MEEPKVSYFCEKGSFFNFYLHDFDIIPFIFDGGENWEALFN